MKRSDCRLSELLLCPRWGIHVMRVCGILPGDVHVDQGGNIVESWSTRGVICTCVSISLGLSLTAVSLIASRTPTFSNSSHTSSSLEMINLFLSTVFPLLTISVFVLMNSRWFLFLRHLLQADKSLSLWDQDDESRTSSLALSLLTFATFVSNGYMVYSAVQDQVVLICSPVVWVTILWQNVMAETTQALMVVVLHALTVRLRRLNRTVQIHNTRRFRYIENTKLHIISSDIQAKSRSDGTVYYLADKCPCNNVTDIQHLAKIHDSLIEASRVIGSFLSLLSPLYVLITFLGSIMLCFMLVSYIMGAHNQLPISFGTSIAVFCFMRTLEFSIVLYYCQIPSSEAYKTPVYVHKLYSVTVNVTLKSELLLFSNQLTKRNFIFSACGMFQLNISLIYSIVSAISTYLVILVQFQFM